MEKKMSELKTHKTVLATAVKAAMIATAVSVSSVALVGCKLTESSNTTVGKAQYQQVKAPKGDIQGQVQDTNGNPIAGAIVQAGGKTTKTDAQGVYTLKSVAVTNVTNTSKGNGDAGDPAGANDQELQVRITPPAAKKAKKGEVQELPAYLAATVVVKPTAQMSTTGSENAVQTIFIEGFNVSAGTSVLPKLTAGVKGVLRNAETGEALPNTKIHADMIQVRDNQEAGNNRIGTSYQTLQYVTVTNDKGEFEFANLPEDSELKLWVDGAWKTELNNTVTTDEGESVVKFIGNVTVEPVRGDDGEEPFITSVDGVNNNFAGRGVLNRSIDGTKGIVLNLSEPVDASLLNANNVRVFSETKNSYLDVASVVVASNKKSITVTLANALANNEKFNIFLPVSDIADLSGNLIDAAKTAPKSINFDAIDGVAGFDHIKVMLQAMGVVTPVSGVNYAAQTQTDPRGDSFSALSLHSAAFVDNNEPDNRISQLNSAADDDGANGIDASERLTALVQAIAGAAGLNVPAGVDVDVARIEFTPTNVGDYHIQLLDQTGARQALNVGGATTRNVDYGGLYDAGDAAKGEVYTWEGQGNAYFQLNNVKPGWTVQIRELDELGNPGPWAKVSLLDEVPPTTALQPSYGYGNGVTGDVAIIYGAGGELANVSDGTIGLPRLSVTPLLFAAQVDANGVINPALNVAESLRTLYNGRLKDTDNTIATFGDYIGGNNAHRYDAQSFANWAAQARTVGVAFTENLSNSLLATPSFSGAAALTNYRVANDVMKTSSNGVENNDLVVFDVDSVLKLGADHEKLLSFEGVVTDVDGNVADKSAKVVVTDRMPAFVVDAEYKNDRTLTVTFNEPVTVKTGDVLDLGQNITVSPKQNRALAVTHTFDSTEITQGAGVNGIANALPIIVGNANAATQINDVADESLNPRFLAMNYETVEDANGNAWDDYSADIQAPEFLVKVPAKFSVTSSANNRFVAGENDTFIVTVNFSAPVNPQLWNAAFDEKTKTSFSEADLGSIITSGAFFPGADETTATLTDDKKRLIITVKLNGAVLASGDQVVFNDGLLKTSPFEAANPAGGNPLTLEVQ